MPNPFWKDFYWISKNYETGIRYRVYMNDALSITVIVRVVPLVAGLICNTNFYSMRMQNLGRMLGFEVNFLFALKCLIKKYPIKVLSIGLFSSVFIFSFTIRVCEL